MPIGVIAFDEGICELEDEQFEEIGKLSFGFKLEPAIKNSEKKDEFSVESLRKMPIKELRDMLEEDLAEVITEEDLILAREMKKPELAEFIFMQTTKE